MKETFPYEQKSDAQAAGAVCLVLLLSGCKPAKKNTAPLSWTRWNGFDDFLELADRTYPEIEWEYTTYAGANRTGYSWAQTRADDIPDIFITSQYWMRSWQRNGWWICPTMAL